MSRIFSRGMFAITFLALLSVGVTPDARAQGCSLSQVAGKWAFSTNGNVIGTGPRVSAGVFALDNFGHVLHGKATSSLNGTIFSEFFSGSYSVNPDCTGTLSVLITDTSDNPLFTVTLAAYFDDDAREIRGIFSSVVLVENGADAPLATAISFEARKIGEQ